jgi:hypothetical protein
MTLDIKKIKNISDSMEAEHRKWIEEENERRNELARQRQLALPELLNKQAGEAIKKIPQILEQAARKGKRQAVVYSVLKSDRYGLYIWPLNFLGSFFLYSFPEDFRKVYRYCEANKLSITLIRDTVFSGEDDFVGTKKCILKVHW